MRKIITLLCAGLWATSVTWAQTITIHHIGPFTGQLANSNIEALKGAEMYFDYINAQGGINGKKIALEKLDDKQDAKESARLFQELIDKKQVTALIMARTTPSAQAMMPLAEKHGVLMFSLQSGALDVTEPFKRNVFTLRASYQDEVIDIIRQMHSTGTQRFAFLAATDSFGKDVMQGADKVLKELQLKPVAVEPVDQRTPVVDQAVANMLAARPQPQLIILIAGIKGASDFVKLYRQKGGTAQFATISNNGSDVFVKALGDFKRGVIITQVVPTPFRKNTKFVRDYLAIAQAAKISPSFNNLYGYLTARVLCEGIRRSGKDVSSARLIKSLDSLGIYDLGDYHVEFNSKQRMGSKFVESSIISQDGRFAN
jgi:branched-chain amino acid transport system substrate-binding protein